ncbi:DUF763 domain-containing protein [Syntrophomonas erecta]
MKTGTANLPLHGGNCPAWLFKHMKSLSAAIIEIVIEDFGVEEVLKRLADPYWFQALGCVVGFDWHSSGLTTTLCGALKEGLAEIGPRAGLFMAGGKGKTSRKTPHEIVTIADNYPLHCRPDDLVYASKMAAKVDNAAVQDNYHIYHHFFVFTDKGSWAVVQQGMNEPICQARRYHWLSTVMPSFTEEPQAAICCDQIGQTLNLVSKENSHLRWLTPEIVGQHPDKVLQELEHITSTHLNLPQAHPIPRTAYLNRSIRAAYEEHPQDFEQLLGVTGVGPGTLRALCLVAEVAYGVQPSYTDPVRYAFAHGGKDGFPFPVNEKDIELSYSTLNRALHRARMGRHDQLEALKKLAAWHARAATVVSSPLPRSFSDTKPVVPPLVQGRLFS